MIVVAETDAARVARPMLPPSRMEGNSLGLIAFVLRSRAFTTASALARSRSISTLAAAFLAAFSSLRRNSGDIAIRGRRVGYAVSRARAQRTRSACRFARRAIANHHRRTAPRSGHPTAATGGHPRAGSRALGTAAGTRAGPGAVAARAAR
jgi:hypothetical protein